MDHSKLDNKYTIDDKTYRLRNRYAVVSHYREIMLWKRWQSTIERTKLLLYHHQHHHMPLCICSLSLSLSLSPPTPLLPPHSLRNDEFDDNLLVRYVRQHTVGGSHSPISFIPPKQQRTGEDVFVRFMMMGGGDDDIILPTCVWPTNSDQNQHHRII